jgi:hypothetical protein
MSSRIVGDRLVCNFQSRAEGFVMKRTFLVVAAAAIVVVAGCGVTDRVGNQGGPEYVSFSTDDGLIEFRFPAAWHENPEDHPFDLNCFSKFETMTTGVFVFLREDLATGFTPLDTLQNQIGDLESKRGNFRVVEPMAVKDHAGKRLTTVVYSGEKGSGKYYYRFTLIEFSDNPNLFAVALQNTFPSDWHQNEAIFDGITKSARLTR